MDQTENASLEGMTRRRLLRAGGGLLLAPWFVSACDQDSGDSDADLDAKEAPDLAKLVEDGELPPLDQRLPEEPLIVEPIEDIGRYGGTLRTFTSGPANSVELYPMVAYEHLVRWTTSWTGAPGNNEIIPNISINAEVSDDAREFTFSLRPGMRWSDGEPFTVDDVIFNVQDVLLNQDINPVTPALLTVAGKPASIEQVDETSFRIIFPSPAGLFLQQVASPVSGGQELARYPKHYLEQFHQDFNPDADALANDEGFDDWVQLFDAKAPRWPGDNPDLPTLGPWKLVTPYAEGQEVVFERNPYYWKVDPEGRQLPYADRVEFAVISDAEAQLLRTLNGEIDLTAFPSSTINTSKNKPVLAESRDDGEYRLVDVTPTHMNVMLIELNLAHQDAVKREIFQNKNFRIALSHAINRQEIIDTSLQRQGEPYQGAPVPDSPFYDEELATQYLTFDVDLANSLLDESFPDTNGDGIRLRPDGNPISIQVGFVVDQTATWADIMELVRGYWRDVGVDLRLDPVDRSLWEERRDANEHDAGVWLGGGGLDVILNPFNYFPSRTGAIYGVPWAAWYASGGAAGEEPPPPVRQQMDLYDQLTLSGDPDEQASLMKALLDITKEQFYCIGIARETNEYLVASNRIHNFPSKMIRGWTYPSPGPTWPEQYYIA